MLKSTEAPLRGSGWLAWEGKGPEQKWSKRATKHSVALLPTAALTCCCPRVGTIITFLPARWLSWPEDKWLLVGQREAGRWVNVHRAWNLCRAWGGSSCRQAGWWENVKVGIKYSVGYDVEPWAGDLQPGAWGRKVKSCSLWLCGPMQWGLGQAQLPHELIASDVWEGFYDVRNSRCSCSNWLEHSLVNHLLPVLNASSYWTSVFPH